MESGKSKNLKFCSHVSLKPFCNTALIKEYFFESLFGIFEPFGIFTEGINIIYLVERTIRGSRMGHGGQVFPDRIALI